MREKPRTQFFDPATSEQGKIEARKRMNSLPPIGVLLYFEEEVGYFTTDPLYRAHREKDIVFAFRDIILVIDNHHHAKDMAEDRAKCYSLRHQRLFYGDPGVVNYFFAPLEE